MRVISFRGFERIQEVKGRGRGRRLRRHRRRRRLAHGQCLRHGQERRRGAEEFVHGIVSTSEAVIGFVVRWVSSAKGGNLHGLVALRLLRTGDGGHWRLLAAGAKDCFMVVVEAVKRGRATGVQRGVVIVEVIGVGRKEFDVRAGVGMVGGGDGLLPGKRGFRFVVGGEVEGDDRGRGRRA